MSNIDYSDSDRVDDGKLADEIIELALSKKGYKIKFLNRVNFYLL